MIVDASVALKLVLPEPDSEQALALAARHGLAAPELLLAEAAHVIGKRTRGRLIDRRQAMAAWDRLRGLPIAYVTIAPLADLAMRLSLALGAGLYDCLYLALAVESRQPLVTSDARFVRGLASTAWAGTAVLLADA